MGDDDVVKNWLKSVHNRGYGYLSSKPSWIDVPIEFGVSGSVGMVSDHIHPVNINTSGSSDHLMNPIVNDNTGGWNSTETYLGDCVREFGNPPKIDAEDWLDYSTIDWSKIKIKNIKKREEKKMVRRVITLYIFDSDENVPDKDALLFNVDNQLSSLNDTDFIDEFVDIRAILKKHNAKRALIKDPENPDEMLKPIRRSDLTLVWR